MVENAQLWQLLKDDGITLEDITERTGHSLGYLVNVVQGRTPLSDALKFKIARAYPQLAAFLLNGGNGTPEPDAALAGPARDGGDDD